MRASARVLAAIAVATALAIGRTLPACGGPAFTVAASDAGADADTGASNGDGARTDGIPPPPGQVTCKGMLIDASNCASCGDPFLCTQNRTECLGACDACDTRSRACVTCPAAGSPFGVCLLLDPNGNINCSEPPADRCGCSAPSPMACPFDFQVCRTVVGAGDRCLTCGETLTAGLPCKGGGFCSAMDSMCH
jgi:hypothetical protein